MLGALGFLTVAGPARRPRPAALVWFPVVGAAIGAVVGLVWWGASAAWRGPLVPAALAVVADLVVTGLLHVDGLADSADGLLGHLSRERRLAVMSGPEIGAFGLAVTVAVLVVRFASFAQLRPEVALVAGLWCLSRSVMVGAMLVLPYARGPRGLAAAFLGGGRAAPGLAAAAGAGAGAALAIFSGGAPAAGGVGAGVLLPVGLLLLARRRLGGFTGDVLGASVVLSETAALLVSGIRW
ncbi:MAG TPA: adenosylcobinamide-GDP ribazoletransferase [Acidimicrobiales bacterium]|nr:adenosylcobinamide-GDP ribazoletransferase [Acidimicrobiales bacterium]